MKKLKLLKNRFVIIFIMMISISLLILFSNGVINLPLDSTILNEQKIIIEFLLSYFIADIPFQYDSALFNIYLGWTIGVLFGSLILANPKKSLTNITILISLISYFLLIFGFRHSPNYFNYIFPQLFIQIISLLIYNCLISFMASFFIEKIYQKIKSDENYELKIEILAKNNKIKCPHCGTEYESIPLYCYNCSKKIKRNNENL